MGPSWFRKIIAGAVRGTTAQASPPRRRARAPANPARTRTPLPATALACKGRRARPGSVRRHCKAEARLVLKTGARSGPTQDSIGGGAQLPGTGQPPSTKGPRGGQENSNCCSGKPSTEHSSPPPRPHHPRPLQSCHSGTAPPPRRAGAEALPWEPPPVGLSLPLPSQPPNSSTSVQSRAGSTRGRHAPLLRSPSRATLPSPHPADCTEEERGSCQAPSSLQEPPPPSWGPHRREGQGERECGRAGRFLGKGKL